MENHNPLTLTLNYEEKILTLLKNISPNITHTHLTILKELETRLFNEWGDDYYEILPPHMILSIILTKITEDDIQQYNIIGDPYHFLNKLYYRIKAELLLNL